MTVVMRILRLRAGVLILLCSLLAGLSSAAGPLPRKAQEFVIQMPDGKQLLLSSYRGKAVALAIMFTTCPHCQKMTKEVLTGIARDYEGKGAAVLGATINPSAPQDIQQFIRVFGVNFPCGVSSEKAARQFLGLTADEPYFVPILVFIDKNGMIRGQYIGDEKFLANQDGNIRAELDKMLKGSASSARKVAPKGPKS
jgi:peroxiredoxin